MDLENSVVRNIEERIKRLRTKQDEDGSWEYCFEGSLMTDSFMILLMNDLEYKNQKVMDGIIDRIINLQHPNGAWKLYEDEKEGNLNATVQAYIALLISKKYTKEQSSMKKAEKFIRENGGIKKTHFMLKVILATHGLIEYPKLFYFPMSYFLLPDKMPLSLFDLSNYARVHLVPMILCINKRFKVKLDDDLTIDHLLETSEVDWFYEERGSFYQFLLEEGKKLASYPLYFHQKGYEKAKRFILDRIETNGTFYSYATSTFYMIYALMALGYETTSSVIQNALEGLLSYAADTEAGIHIQNSPSKVWDTALLSYAIQEAGYKINDPIVSKSIQYLMKKQQNMIGDWSVHAKNLTPGGWGFSDVNSFIPDNDDTGAALRAIARYAMDQPNIQKEWLKGVHFLLGLQNIDGGWGAFEKNVNNKWLTYVPIENAKDAIIDPSTADLTGRVLEFIGHYTSISNDDPIVKKTVDWLLKNQKSNGSWYGRWGICYIYGTWAAITGLRAVGVPKNHAAIKKAEKWLVSIQNEDGGWGESGHSLVKGSYVSLKYSTPSQTAWAVDALLSIRNKEDEVIRKGIKFLTTQSDLTNKALSYPTGLGLPGQFYIHYHSYNEIYPLLALAHFKNS
ncbi:prenyltransferase/squalene oxidase repeat-containing protein [Bacillus sp. AFS041924]|uniref:terpene cyclase/mutase family protein n=1 Tax=Bacillus sp. AFS041924 TaxID=2033503 RepID=UPI000BFE9B39|nr:prenyltransferase/squalene oxidase repeat-containing protein [Bacillus sp. AFS041924]PGS49688.1 squalene--hopene cyclase [Bacillus sp. AFS041924]